MSLKSLRLDLETDAAQKALLWSQSNIANKLYNHLLELVEGEQKHYEEYKEKKNFSIFSKYDLRDQMLLLKEQKPIYKTVYSSIMKNVSFRLSNGIAAWRRGITTGEYVGFPKFRSIKDRGFFSLKYEDPFVGYKIADNKLELSLGGILQENGKRKQVKLSLPFKKKIKFDLSKIKTLSINKDRYSDEFVVEIVLEVDDLEKVRNIKNYIAFDPNHKNLMVGVDSDGDSFTFQNLKTIKTIDKRIGDIKKLRKKCVAESRRYQYLTKRIHDLYRKRREQIKVFERTIANYLCRNYDAIGVGDYVPFAKAHNPHLNKAIINQSHIGSLRRTIEQIAARSGKIFIKLDEYLSTQTCNDCKERNGFLANNTKIREYFCGHCGVFHIRDENSSQNLMENLELELQISPTLPGSGYRSIKNRYACSFDGRKIYRLKEQGINFVKENDESLSNKT